MVVTTEPVWKALNELAKRGISLQYITDINRENISFCKIMIENGTQLRHLPGIKSNFGITDRTEYMATVIMEEEKPLWHAIVSNAKTFVEGQQSVFDALWSKALPAEQRIREIEEGFKMFTETIFDASEIEKITFDSVKSAKEEITILFSTADAFKRQERVGLMRLLQETDPSVKVRILIPTSFALRDIIKDRLDEDQRIEIRYFLNSSLQTILTSLTVDRKLCLIAEMENNTKDNSRKTVELATYSNSDSIVAQLTNSN